MQSWSQIQTQSNTSDISISQKYSQQLVWSIQSMMSQHQPASQSPDNHIADAEPVTDNSLRMKIIPLQLEIRDLVLSRIQTQSYVVKIELIHKENDKRAQMNQIQNELNKWYRSQLHSMQRQMTVSKNISQSLEIKIECLKEKMQVQRQRMRSQILVLSNAKAHNILLKKTLFTLEESQQQERMQWNRQREHWQLYQQKLKKEKKQWKSQLKHSQIDQERFQQQNSILKQQIKYLNTTIKNLDDLCTSYLTKTVVDLEQSRALAEQLKSRPLFIEEARQLLHKKGK